MIAGKDFCTLVHFINSITSVVLAQFNIDPGDYNFTGISWNGNVYIDTRLAMGLRSSAFCCQSATELVAKIVGREAHVLVYLDDFGGPGAGL